MQMEKNAVFTNDVYSFCAYLTENEFFSQERVKI